VRPAGIFGFARRVPGVAPSGSRPGAPAGTLKVVPASASVEVTMRTFFVAVATVLLIVVGFLLPVLCPGPTGRGFRRSPTATGPTTSMPSTSRAPA